jgi:DNA-binding LacI/PurR family transcriptional regulator
MEAPLNLSKKITIQHGTAETLTAQLIRQLEELILNGEFTENPRLPSAMQIAKQIKLSYCTVETALRELVRRNLIERNHRGSFVRKRYSRSAVKDIAVVFFSRRERDRLYKRKILEGIAEALPEDGFNLTVVVEEELREQGLDWWEEVGASGRYAGIILDKECTLDAETLKLLRHTDTPCILFNSGVSSLFDSYLRICPDFPRAFTQLIQHVCGLGRQRIALLTGEHDSYPHYIFRTVWRETLRAYEIVPNDHYLVDSIPHEKARIQAATLALLSLPAMPDAIMCGDDVIAYHVVQTVRERGLRVPEDISVTGFGGFDVAEIMEPKLTTVKINLAQMGRIVGGKMLALIRGGAETGVIVIGHELVVGESTAACHATASVSKARKVRLRAGAEEQIEPKGFRKYGAVQEVPI